MIFLLFWLQPRPNTFTKILGKFLKKKKKKKPDLSAKGEPDETDLGLTLKLRDPQTS